MQWRHDAGGFSFPQTSASTAAATQSSSRQRQAKSTVIGLKRRTCRRNLRRSGSPKKGARELKRERFQSVAKIYIYIYNICNQKMTKKETEMAWPEKGETWTISSTVVMKASFQTDTDVSPPSCLFLKAIVKRVDHLWRHNTSTEPRYLYTPVNTDMALVFRWGRLYLSQTWSLVLPRWAISWPRHLSQGLPWQESNDGWMYRHTCSVFIRMLDGCMSWS